MSKAMSLSNTRDEAIGYALLAGWITEEEAERRAQQNYEDTRRHLAVEALYRAHKREGDSGLD